MDQWTAMERYRVTYTVKTMTSGHFIDPDGRYGKYTGYARGIHVQIHLQHSAPEHRVERIRLKDNVDVEKPAENMFAGTGYHVKEDLADYFRERLEAMLSDSPDALAQSLAGYDY